MTHLIGHLFNEIDTLAPIQSDSKGLILLYSIELDPNWIFRERRGRILSCLKSLITNYDIRLLQGQAMRN